MRLVSQLAPSDKTLKEFHESIVKDSEAKAKKAQILSLVVSFVDGLLGVVDWRGVASWDSL